MICQTFQTFHQILFEQIKIIIVVIFLWPAARMKILNRYLYVLRYFDSIYTLQEMSVKNLVH